MAVCRNLYHKEIQNDKHSWNTVHAPATRHVCCWRKCYQNKKTIYKKGDTFLGCSASEAYYLMAPAHRNMKEPGKVISKWLPWGQGPNNAHWRKWSLRTWGTMERMAEHQNRAVPVEVGGDWIHRYQCQAGIPLIPRIPNSWSRSTVTEVKVRLTWFDFQPHHFLCVLGHIT